MVRRRTTAEPVPGTLAPKIGTYLMKYAVPLIMFDMLKNYKYSAKMETVSTFAEYWVTDEP